MTLFRRIESLDREITQKLTQRLQDARHGPWMLTCDGATNRGDPLISVDAMNGAGECWHVKLVDCGALQQDATRIKVGIFVCVQQQYRSHTSIPILFSPSQFNAFLHFVETHSETFSAPSGRRFYVNKLNASE